jgi:hypothetical protein
VQYDLLILYIHFYFYFAALVLYSEPTPMAEKTLGVSNFRVCLLPREQKLCVISPVLFEKNCAQIDLAIGRCVIDTIFLHPGFFFFFPHFRRA